MFLILLFMPTADKVRRLGTIYLNNGLQLVQSYLRMDIDIAFDSVLFMPTACFLVFSY